jgi:hypothetical protein
MYEHRGEPLLTRIQFAWRVLAHLAMAAGAVAVALGIGVAGYRFIAGLPLIDAFLNASMILGGMGPTSDPLPTAAAKTFASLYALFSGLFFIALLGLLLAPFFHRVMHKLHLDEGD